MSNYETNPVGALQERFQSRGIVPQYNVVQAEGASHDPTFVFPPVTDAASKPDAPGNTVRALKELYVKKDAGWEHDSEGSQDEKDIDLKECDERCLKHPQGLIRRNGIKINLITLEKSKEITELDNNATNEDLQSSEQVDSQIMKAVSNELQIKSINNNIAENLGQEEPGAWMKNIKSPQKVYISTEKLGSYLKKDHQNELSRDLEMRRFPENERGRSQERHSSRESQLKNQQHRKIFESDIDDLLNNCRKDVDFGKRSEDSKNNSRKSEKSRKRSRSRRSRSRRRSTKRHGRKRERDQSNCDKRNASSTFIDKGKKERE